MRTTVLGLGLVLALASLGCTPARVVPLFDSGPRDAATVVDANRPDAPGTDGAVPDAAVVDAGIDAAVGMDAGGDDAGGTDAGGIDAASPDAAMGDAGRDAAMGDAGMVDAGMLTTSAQIAAIRAAAIGAMDRPVTGATVTYVRPLLGVDPAGFFVQADRTGPALFVAVTPSTLSPVPVAGDVVSFRATTTAVDHVQIRVTGISGFMRTATGRDVSLLVQDLSTAADLVSGVDGYESEIVRVRGRLGALVVSGTGHQGALLATAGVPSSPNLFFRAPDAVWTSSMLVQGCDVSVDAAPLWRYDARVQPSAWDAADLVIHSCPRPRVLSASAASSTSVTVTFDQALASATVVPGAFTISGGVTVSAAVLGGSTVTLTTSALTPMTTFTVTAAASVTSIRGDGVDPAANNAMFTTVGSMPVDHLVINEVDYDQVGAGDSVEFIELFNGSGASIDLSRFAVSLITGSSGGEYTRVALSGTLPAGQYAVLASASTLGGLTAAVEITIPGTIDLIQNGMPDGIALIDTATSTLADALSYEGSMTGLTIVGVTGTASLVEGTVTTVVDSNATVGSLCRRPNGTDTNDAASDWAFCAAASPGAPNP